MCSVFLSFFPSFFFFLKKIKVFFFKEIMSSGRIRVESIFEAKSWKLKIGMLKLKKKKISYLFAKL